MLQYLLLRDNKQSGPYTLEDLITKGLKGYDLIWIEGKSAAWRYPSEIEELKAYAPVVEEQPYDRFYKKTNNNQKKEEQSTKTPQEEKTVNTPQEIKEIPTPRKGINVERKEIQPAVNSNQDSPSSNRKVVVILPASSNKDRQPERIVFHETVENKIAQSLPQEDLLKQRQRSYKSSEEITILPKLRKSNPVKATGIIGGVILLLSIGVAIGWTFSQTQVSDKILVPLEPAPTSTRTVQMETPQANIESAVNETVPDPNLQYGNPEQVIDSIPVDYSIPATKNTITPKAPVNKILHTETKPEVAEQEVTKEPQMKQEEVAKTPAENDDASEKRAVKKNINDLVKIVKTDYKVGAFGGLNNIELKVTNNSPYVVDLVVVEVKYLLANTKEFKTENIYFKNLSPGSTMSKEAPKSTRGIKIVSKVALITSKALGMYQASL